MKMNMNNICRMCKELREEMKLLQSDVANDTGYSKENVSAFENGRNNNAKILLWYIENGLYIERRNENEEDI